MELLSFLLFHQLEPLMLCKVKLLALISMAQSVINNIKLASFNCRGFNSRKKSPFINQLLCDCSFLFIQEHWLSDRQIGDLASINDDFLVHGVSGFDNSTVLAGRPYGGCAILWNKHLNCKVTPVSVQSRRIPAIEVEMPTYCLLLVNVYLPYEDGSGKVIDEFTTQLSIIESLLSDYCDC